MVCVILLPLSGKAKVEVVCLGYMLHVYERSKNNHELIVILVLSKLLENHLLLPHSVVLWVHLLGNLLYLRLVLL